MYLQFFFTKVSSHQRPALDSVRLQSSKTFSSSVVEYSSMTTAPKRGICIPKRLAQLGSSKRPPPPVDHFSNSTQTSDEGSDINDGSGSGYESLGNISSSDTMDQASPSPPVFKLVQSPKYMIVNGKLCAKTKNPKPYACTYRGCGKSYRKPSRLEEHERSHTGERPFRCLTCTKSYLRESHLRAHSRAHLPSSARPFVCAHQVTAFNKNQTQNLVPTQRDPVEILSPSTSTTQACNQRFWTAQHLRVHEQAVHFGEKPYKCTLCCATFAKHGALRTHTAESHSPPGTKPYQCEYLDCAQNFLTNQKLRVHARVHDTTRYACVHDQCSPAGQSPVQFATWTALQTHTRTEHPPTCPYTSCNNRIFSSSRGLRSHIKTHEEREKEEAYLLNIQESSPAVGSKRSYGEEIGELVEPPLKRRRGGEVGRDWPCPKDGCSKAFKSQKAQTNHVRVSHEGSRNFPCPNEGCAESFGYKHVMQRHVERHHREAASTTEQALQPITNGPVTHGQTVIEALTGRQGSAKNRPRVIACPWPDGFGGSVAANRTIPRLRCGFMFSRAYDLRRHLKSAHGLEIEPDEANAWVLKHKC